MIPRIRSSKRARAQAIDRLRKALNEDSACLDRREFEKASIVDFIRRKLKLGGVLYVSHNTLPG